MVKFSARNCPGINFRKVGNYDLCLSQVALLGGAAVMGYRPGVCGARASARERGGFERTKRTTPESAPAFVGQTNTTISRVGRQFLGGFQGQYIHDDNALIEVLRARFARNLRVSGGMLPWEMFAIFRPFELNSDGFLVFFLSIIDKQFEGSRINCMCIIHFAYFTC